MSIELFNSILIVVCFWGAVLLYIFSKFNIYEVVIITYFEEIIGLTAYILYYDIQLKPETLVMLMFGISLCIGFIAWGAYVYFIANPRIEKEHRDFCAEMQKSEEEYDNFCNTLHNCKNEEERRNLELDSYFKHKIFFTKKDK